MINNRLRVYREPVLDNSTSVLSLGNGASSHSQTTTMRAGEVFEALNDALQYGRTWLNDFSDDEITLSNDLYDVIQAYRQFRRPSA